MLDVFKKSRAALLSLGIASAAAAYSHVSLADEGPLHYLNIQTIHPQTRQAFIEAMRHNATQSREEAANIVFDVADIGGSEPTLVLFESWRDAAGYQQHEASAHVAPVLALVPTSFAEPERKYLLQNVPGLPAPSRKVIDTPSDTRNFVHRFEVAANQREAFLGAAASSINHARQQPGNRVFDIYQQQDNANAFVIYQRWSDTQAYLDYAALPSAAAFNDTIQAAQSGEAERLDLHDRIVR